MDANQHRDTCADCGRVVWLPYKAEPLQYVQCEPCHYAHLEWAAAINSTVPGI